MSDDLANRSRHIARERYWETHEKGSYVCPDCGRREEQIVDTFHVHHQSKDPYDNRLDSLIGLCGFCHRLREGKKPSLERIQRFREESIAGDDNERYDPRIRSFISKFACLCSEGREYRWTDCIEVWWRRFDSHLEGWGYQLNDELRTELICALQQLSETELQWAGGELHVTGPDPHGHENCDCLTAEDMQRDFIEVLSDV